VTFGDACADVDGDGRNADKARYEREVPLTARASLARPTWRALPPTRRASVLRSELVAVSRQLLDGPPEFALRRAMELAGLILAAVARNDREEEREATE